jgi:signal transduction histidine kinase
MGRIFEPMKQAAEDAPKRAEGLGLGLYIARAIATAHHGAIDVDSTKEDGTTFTVRLPHDARAAVAERRTVQSGRRLSDGRIRA